MHTMRLVFSLLVVSITVSSVHALEWVEYEGTIPENAVSVNEGTEDRPVCRKNSRIGIVNDAGKCYSVKVGGGVSKKTEDDGYQILVDNSGAEIASLQSDIDGMVTQADFDAAVAAATEGMYTQTDIDAAVAEATEDMYTQAEYDAAFKDATADMMTVESFAEQYCDSSPPGTIEDCGHEQNAYDNGHSTASAESADEISALETENINLKAQIEANDSIYTQAEYDAAIEDATGDMMTVESFAEQYCDSNPPGVIEDCGVELHHDDLRFIMVGQ